MPVYAGRRVAVLIASLSPPHVLSERDRLKMRRAHARAIAAKMIEREAIGDRAYEGFVGDTMSDAGTARQA